jgi:hypothetical protein
MGFRGPVRRPHCLVLLNYFNQFLMDHRYFNHYLSLNLLIKFVRYLHQSFLNYPQ